MNLEPFPFSLRQLQYVVAVAECLSFREAAARCQVSQPSLSIQLAQLEKVLAVKLFERDRRRVLITPSGHALIERARGILRDAEDVVALARLSGDPLAGTLRFGVIPTLSPYLLPALTRALRSAYPELKAIWTEDKTDVLVRSLEAGRIDAAFVALEAELGDVERDVIGHDPFVLATPPGHPLGAKATPATPAELRNASVLLLDEGHCLREQALAFCAGAKVHELAFRATSLSTLAQMVAGGSGVTLLPQLSIPTEARRAKLRLRRFVEPAPKRTIALVWRPRSPLEPALRRLAVTARSAFPAPTSTRPLRST
jgi:LysR family hydrogen peroxide-inducible transcriptional activator